MSRFLKTEIIWESTNNKWIVKRYNSFNNTNDEFDLFDYHIHSLSKNGLKSPLLFPYVYWKDIIHRKNKLLSILIEFTNYNEDLYKYTVLLKAIKLNGQQVVDGFSSTETDVIDQVELLKNILLFLEFAEKK